jgi:hypothetical protein
MNAIILKGAALRQPPLPQSGPEPKQLPTPGLLHIATSLRPEQYRACNVPQGPSGHRAVW